jgi:DNA-binding response OmpR family regulator
MYPSVSHQTEASKPTILVLDDDMLSLELYSRELSSNYRVITCERTEDARQCLKDKLMTAVILEPALSGEDGWILISEIRSSPNPIPVIVCSVLDERKVGLEQGADAFLVKPVLPTTLHHLIDQVVAQKSAKPDY